MQQYEFLNSFSKPLNLAPAYRNILFKSVDLSQKAKINLLNETTIPKSTVMWIIITYDGYFNMNFCLLSLFFCTTDNVHLSVFSHHLCPRSTADSF